MARFEVPSVNGKVEAAVDPFPAGIRRCKQDLLPVGVEVAVVPGNVLLDHRPCGGMGRHVVGPALAHHPNPAPVPQGRTPKQES